MSFSHFPMSFPIFCQTFSLFNFIIIIIIIIIYIYIYITEAFGAPTIFHVTTNFFFYILYIYYFSSTSDLFLSLKCIQDSFYNPSSHKLLIHSKTNTIEIY